MSIFDRLPVPDSPRDRDMVLIGIILGFLPVIVILAIIVAVQ